MIRRSLEIIGYFMMFVLVSIPETVLAQIPGRDSGSGISVGMEYAPADNPAIARNLAEAFAETGMPGMKHFPDAVKWGSMQKGPDKPLDFTKFDRFVTEYQRQGFMELRAALNPRCSWGCRDVKLLAASNMSPKPEYRQHYQNWVRAIVERYDGDGLDDMPGLRWPVQIFEIGTEFSSFEPEPVEEYLDTLALAYSAAHQASGNVRIAHAAFLIAPVNLNVQNPADYDRVWVETERRDQHHGLADMRQILDHPGYFDLINFHNLGCPYEIEDVMKWLKYETGQRGYSKPVIISDTVCTSYIGWGSATRCKGKNLGLISYPATESDRCDLAKYFKKLISGNREVLNWTRGFVAADHVQRTIIAAEQGIDLINLWCVADLPGATSGLFQAAAGISAWSGALKVNYLNGKVTGRYPSFYAVKQLMKHIDGYDSISRIPAADPQIRVYRLSRGSFNTWIAWLDPQKAILPGTPVQSGNAVLEINAEKVRIEPVITAMDQIQPEHRVEPVKNGILRLNLTHTPVFITPEH